LSVPDRSIVIAAPPYIREYGLRMQHSLHILEVQTGIEHIPQLVPQGLRLLPDTAVQVHKITVEVVKHFKIIARRLMEQHPSGPAEHFDIPFVVSWEAGEDLVPKGFLPADPRHKAVDGITSFAEASAHTKVPQKTERSRFPCTEHPYTQNDLFDLDF